MKLRTLALALTALFAASTAAQAQTGACPSTTTLTIFQVGATLNACMVPSLDPTGGHSAVDSAGRPVVVRYDILLINDGDPVSGTAQATINIGKPAINAQNAVWFVLPNASVPVDRRFRATAVAIGQADANPSASPRSPLSNPFVVAAARTPTAPGAPAVP